MSGWVHIDSDETAAAFVGQIVRVQALADHRVDVSGAHGQVVRVRPPIASGCSVVELPDHSEVLDINWRHRRNVHFRLEGQTP
jgi:hypothetical protein